MECHTCGGKGHFKWECPNRKVVLINDDTMSMGPVMMLIRMVPMMMTLVMMVLMPVLPPQTTLFAHSVRLMCHLHLKVSGAICSKQKHLLDRTKLANSSLMVVVAATLIAKS
jgi:hypothetical protein